MKTATISFAGGDKKEITITGSKLTLQIETPLLNIKDGEETVLAVFLNQLVYVQLKRE